ncbi:ABC transporter substrate-binding protein [Streptomyces sp. NPDC055607]
MRRSLSYRACGLVLATGLLVTTAACSGAGDRKASSGKAPDRVTLALRNDVDTFDPFTSAGESGAKQMFDAIYDTLVRVGTSGGEVSVRPSMAKKWSVSADTATFTLRDGLTCGDGTPLNASGVARSLRHVADPKTGASASSRIFGPAGVKEIRADDAAHTVTIDLKAPFTYLLQGLAAGAYIVCPSALDDVKSLASRPAPTGPYTLAEARRGERYVLKRRDTPVVDGADLPAEVHLRVVGDDTTRANLVSTGQVDIAPVLGRDAQRLRGASEPVAGPAALASALLFNQAPGLPGANKNVRAALARAVDPVSYAKAATYDLSEKSDTMYTPNMDCYRKANGKLSPAYDPAAAKAGLAAAGYGPGGKRLTIRLIGIETQNSGPDLLADSLRKLGVNVKFLKGNLSQAINTVFGTGDWDVMVFPYESVMPVPSVLVNQIGLAGGIENADYTRLVAQAAGEKGERKCELWGRAEASLLTNVDVRPLVWSHSNWFANGLTFDANYFHVDTRTIRGK